jgi:MFS family permease
VPRWPPSPRPAWLFFAGVAAAGLGYGLVNPPTNVLADPGSPRLRGLTMSIKQTGIPLGGILAGLLVPRAAAAVGWRWATAVPIAGCVAVAAVAALGPRDRSTGTGGGAHSHSGRVDSRRPDRPSGQVVAPGDPTDPTDPTGAGGAGYGPAVALRLRLPLALAFGFLMAGVQVAVFTLLAVYLVDDRGSAATASGTALALLLAGGLAGRPPGAGCPTGGRPTAAASCRSARCCPRRSSRCCRPPVRAGCRSCSPASACARSAGTVPTSLRSPKPGTWPGSARPPVPPCCW